MPAFCLTKDLAKTFRKKLKDGEIDPGKLARMSSSERRAFFIDFLGEDNAKNVNALFESKLLLKNQKVGMITWAKKVSGITEPARRDIISRINRLERVLDPVSEKVFLEDLAAQKLGTTVTSEETKKIFNLARKSENLRQIAISDGLDVASRKQAEINYGNSLIEFAEYKNDLIKDGITPRNLATNILNLPKTVMSTFDVSMYFRQGWGSMSTKEFWKDFHKGIQFFFSEKEFQKTRAEILGSPDFARAEKAGLGITKLNNKLSQREEAFSSSLLDKIPIFRGSERAFVGFLNKLRFDRFNNLVEKARLSGEDVRVGSQATKDIANLVNIFTGRGDLGRLNSLTAELNTTFFSPRKISAHVNMFRPKNFLSPKISNTARQAHIRQLSGSIAMSIGMLSLAKQFGARVTTEPTNSDFGKIIIGDSRIDVTGGNGTYAVLLARTLAGKTTSSTSGKEYQLGTGYKPTTRLDLAARFARNKLSPIASFAANLYGGIDYKGDPINVKDEATNRMRPLIISSIIEMSASDADNDIMAMLILFELFGFGVQTYD